MEKYTWTQQLVLRECAYCDYKCDYLGAGYCKWGQVDTWSCPTHGLFREMAEPMSKRGYQIR